MFVHANQVHLHDFYFSTVVEVFWAEDFYCFNESDENALTMLQTNSSFVDESIGLRAIAREVMDNVTARPIPGTTRSIQFVHFNGIQYGVGSLGE